jgi:hypothetical protein
MAYFRPFSNVISIKMSRARKKYLQHGGGDVMDDVTYKSCIRERPTTLKNLDPRD